MATWAQRQQAAKRQKIAELRRRVGYMGYVDPADEAERRLGRVHGFADSQQGESEYTLTEMRYKDDA